MKATGKSNTQGTIGLEVGWDARLGREMLLGTREEEWIRREGMEGCVGDL